MGRLRRLSASEAATLVVLAIWGFAPLVLMVRYAIAAGDTFTGSDGPFAADQLQYLSWIRDAGEHVLAGNRFDLRPPQHVFLHPMFLLSGLAWKLGLGLQASYLVWKPVAIGVLFAGFALFVRRTLPPSRGRAGALVLALFYLPATAILLEKLGIGSVDSRGQLSGLIGEAFPAGQLWGYLPTAIAVGAMPLYMLAAERALAGRGRTRARAVSAAAFAGLVAAWLHPWQGEVLALVTVGLLVWGRLRRPVLPLLIPLAATVLPLVYYVGLSELDVSWEIARRQQELPRADAWVVLAALAPLLPLAILGAPRRPVELCERALVLWPLAALATYAVLSPSVPGHALEGISLPLSVMSVRGWQALRLPTVAGALAIAALVGPGAILAAGSMRAVVGARIQPHYLRADEARAMDALRRDPRPGGVIADIPLAAAVPVHAGRAVWAGHPSWTLDYAQRARDVDALFGDRMRGPGAVRLLRGSRARFALAGCSSRADLRLIAPAEVVGVRRLGCATIYDLRAPRPLARR